MKANYSHDYCLQKQCKTCGKYKDIMDFYFDSRHKQSSGSTICKDCRINVCKEYRLTNPQKVKATKYKADIRKMGLSLEQYNQKLTEQNNLCAICNQPELNKRLAIDHCHTTNRIRGLLCQRCNTGIGLLGDNVETIQNAIGYLNKWN